MTRAPRTFLVVTLLLAAPVLAGCIGDDGSSGDQPADTSALENATSAVPDWAKPLPETITGVESLAQLGPGDGVESAYQFAYDDEIVYVAAFGAGLYVIDVSDPMNPVQLAHLTEHFGHDAQMLHYDDGTTFVALAGSGDGIAFVNVTDPSKPEIVSTILGGDVANVHNIDVVPGTHLIYNSRSVDTPGVDIVDASDPFNPEVVGVPGDVTCHDFGFHMPDDLAFCAGIRETQIWDISNPEDPSVMTRIHNPAINIHHWAIPAKNGSVLIIGDEWQGATNPSANGCLTSAENPVTGGTTTDPIGALWFYDISDPMVPTPLSYVGASELVPEPTTCTAHFGEIIPGHDKIVVGFLAGGVYTIDFSDLMAPRVIDHLGIGEVVEVEIHHGYAFGTGRDRGLDVFGFTSE